MYWIQLCLADSHNFVSPSPFFLLCLLCLLCLLFLLYTHCIHCLRCLLCPLYPLGYLYLLSLICLLCILYLLWLFGHFCHHCLIYFLYLLYPFVSFASFVYIVSFDSGEEVGGGKMEDQGDKCSRWTNDQTYFFNLDSWIWRYYTKLLVRKWCQHWGQGGAELVSQKVTGGRGGGSERSQNRMTSFMHSLLMLILESEISDQIGSNSFNVLISLLSDHSSCNPPTLQPTSLVAQ